MDCSVVIKGKGEARNYHRSRFDSWKKAVSYSSSSSSVRVIASVDLRVSSRNVGRHRRSGGRSSLDPYYQSRNEALERRFDTAKSAKIKCLTAAIVLRRLWGNIIPRVLTNGNDTIGRRYAAGSLSPIPASISKSPSLLLFFLIRRRSS